MADTTGPFRDVLPLPGADSFGASFVGARGFASGSASASSPHPSAPRAQAPRLIGDLEVLGELARGGMGVVYRAMDRRLGREVAIKVLLTGGAADQEELERFAVEARVAARLKHPNIVGIHRVGEDRGAPYMVMDLVPGESLQRRLGRDGPLPVREAARLCALLARALAFAHGRGVLHRDLKPHNVLLTPEGQPVLTDFGLAKEVGGRDRELTVTGQVLGTPAYMSPEQAIGDGARIDRRADVYGLGATLYAAITGRPPFQGASAIAVLSRVVEEQVEPPRRSRPEVDRDLETIVLKCLEKEPAARYDTAQDLALDLERYLAGEPVRARRLGALARAGRWIRRHRLASAGVASALLLSLAVGVGTTLLEKSRLLDEARAAAEEAQTPLAADATRDARLGHALARLQAAQRWRDLAATPAAREALVDAAFDLGAVARDGAQWELARHAYRLSGLAAEDPRLVQALDEVKEASGAEARRRREAVREALDALGRGEVTDPRETVFALVRYPDASTVELLCERLRGAVDELVRARRQALLDAARPTPVEERAGWRVLVDLPAAVALLEVDEAPPPTAATEEALDVVWEAALRAARRVEPAALDPARVWTAIARVQAQALTEGGVRQARACVEALGRIGAASPSPAVEAVLRAYVRAELDPAATSLGLRALAMLGVSLESRRLLLERRIGLDELPVDLRDVLDPRWLTESDGAPDGIERRAIALVLRGDVAGAREALGAGLARFPDSAPLLVRRAVFNLDDDRPEEALPDAERAVAVASSAVTLGLRAWVLARLGRLAEAQRDAEAAERVGRGTSSPQDASFSWLMIGRARAALGDGPGARAALTRSLEFNPAQTTASTELAQSLLVERKLEQAEAVLDKALAIEPENVIALLARADARSLSGNVEAALDDLETAHTLAPALRGAAEKRAHLLVRMGRLADAASAAEELLQRDPDHAGARWILAHVALAGRRPDIAEEHCERGLRSRTLQPEDHADLLTSLAQARLLLGRAGEALQALGRALQVVPDHTDALVIRAATRLQLNDPTKALEDLDRVIELAPGQAMPYVSRARCHAARGDAAAAARDCERALALDPSFVEARIILSDLAHDRGELAVAERQLTLAIEAEPRGAELKVRRAQVRMRAGDLPGARADLDLAVREAPTMAVAWTLRAELRLSQADRAGAELDVLRAAELEPRDSPTAEAVARILGAVGQVERALAVLDRAIPLQRDEAGRARLERQRAALLRERR